MQPCHTPSLIWNQSIVPCLVLTIASWPTYRFLRRQVRWSGAPISENFPQFAVIHIVRSRHFSGILLPFHFLMIQRMLAIWSLVPLPFLNPAWTFESSWFIYCWSLPWWILSIALLALRWIQLCSSLNTLWLYLSLGLDWKLKFSSTVGTALFQVCWHIECSTFTASSLK